MKYSEKYVKSNTKDIIRNILDGLLDLQWNEGSPQEMKYNELRPDLIAVVKSGNKKRRLFFEVKTTGEPRVIAQLAAYKNLISERDPSVYLILVAPFVSAKGKKLCKDFGIGFVDFQGNAYIRFDNILIDRYGYKSLKHEKRLQKKLFTTKSEWIIRKMLVKPNRTWKTQELANETNVSLGMVYKTTERFEAEGYIEKARGAIRLEKPGELLDAWREKYSYEKQKPTGYYSPIETREELFKRLRELPGSSYALTLGAGASLVAPFVRSTDTHLYINTNFELLKNALSLTPVEFGGNVYIVWPSDGGVFFDTQTIKKVTVVSNLQLYMDLYNYPQRGREQADYLREEKMKI